MTVGAQLYTLRAFTQTPQAFKETLKKVADMGYTAVQVSGTCPYDGDWLNAVLKETGLICPVTHYPVDEIADKPVETAQKHLAFGCKNVGIGYYDFAQFGIDSFVNRYKDAAEVLVQNGMTLMYHNHHHEFKKEGNKTLLEHLAEKFDGLGFILDTYWIQAAGGDPAAWIEKFSGRVSCIHLKDMSFDGKMAVIGEGNINFDRVFTACDRAGSQYLFVEQDDTYGEDPFNCLKRSYQYLKSVGLN